MCPQGGRGGGAASGFPWKHLLHPVSTGSEAQGRRQSACCALHSPSESGCVGSPSLLAASSAGDSGSVTEAQAREMTDEVLEDWRRRPDGFAVNDKEHIIYILEFKLTESVGHG